MCECNVRNRVFVFTSDVEYEYMQLLPADKSKLSTVYRLCSSKLTKVVDKFNGKDSFINSN